MITKKMAKALNVQLNHEFYSAYLYLSMSAYCSKKDFNGAASWFLLQYQEELAHATRIYNYIIEQGAIVSLEQVNKPEKKFGSLLETYQKSLSHEQTMTCMLNDLSNKALNEKDHATYNLLQWFVNEQVEEEAILHEIISKIKLVKNDGYGLLMIDNELAKRTSAKSGALA
ncbi:MAG TPA: ferritin [Sulfurovum sp.]|nr:ferritin [Sulfurovum sp.]